MTYMWSNCLFLVYESNAYLKFKKDKSIWCLNEQQLAIVHNYFLFIRTPL